MNATVDIRRKIIPIMYELKLNWMEEVNIELIPVTKSIFEILLPMIFPMAIPSSFFIHDL